MAQYRLFSITLKIGYSVEHVISEPARQVHAEIATEVYKGVDAFAEILHIGSRTESAISWNDYTFERELIHKSILEKLGVNQCDLLIIDLSSSPLAQGPVPIIYCITAIEEAIAAGFCEYAVILTLERNPVNINLDSFTEPSTRNRILVVSELFTALPKGSHFSEIVHLKLQDRFAEYLKTHATSPKVLLAQKCIRRHGHFFNHATNTSDAVCSDTSYILRDCQQELVSLLEQQLEAISVQPNFLIYDCPGSQDLSQACSAVASSREINCERYVSVFSDPKFARTLSGRGILVVDFVSSGRRVVEVLETLNGLGVNMAPIVIAAVGTTNTRSLTSSLGEVSLAALIDKPPHLEHQRATCPQCRLSIPISNAAAEDDSNIDAFTMHKLVRASGWEQEPMPETPTNRRSFPNIPKFDTILELSGDWLGYKVRRRVDALVKGRATDPLLIYLDQRDANRMIALVQQSRRLEYSTLKIPPEALSLDNVSQGWTTFLENPPEVHKEWVSAFLDSRADGVLIIDNFRATGHTLTKLHSLLATANKRHLGTVTLVDFKQHQSAEIYSLYNWFYPMSSIA